MGLIVDQKVEIKWHSSNKDHYESKGYIYTKMKDIFFVNVGDLTPKSTAKVQCKCDKCESIYIKTYHRYSAERELFGVNYRTYCKKCSSVEAMKYKRVNYNFIVNSFKKRNYTLITTHEEYILGKNNKQKLRYLCNYHINEGEQTIIWGNFHTHNKGCKFCKSEKLAEMYRYDFDFVKTKFEENQFQLLENRYINTEDPMKCKCMKCERIMYKTFKSILRNFQCIYCFKENNIGENHPSWNHELTNEERIINRDYKDYVDWRKAVYERDNYECRVCGEYASGNLNAHHLDGYHWCIGKRTDIDNGITLCEECHNEFHRVNGNRNNTKEQFEEWVKIINKNKEIST